jgi:threonine dehydrogenase-like Zn-dependent dehydrogenase
MRAVTWQGTRKLSVETVPDPEIVQQSDVVVKVAATAICAPTFISRCPTA